MGNELADRVAKDADQKSNITIFPLCVQEIFGNKQEYCSKNVFLEQFFSCSTKSIGRNTGSGIQT